MSCARGDTEVEYLREGGFLLGEDQGWGTVKHFSEQVYVMHGCMLHIKGLGMVLLHAVFCTKGFALHTPGPCILYADLHITYALPLHAV